MKRTFLVTTLVLAAAVARTLPATPGKAQTPDEAITSEVRVTKAGERILVHEVRLEASVEDVWEAYATSAGWEGWAVPHAEVDLRVGGTIRTHYDPGAEIGDEGTNVLHVVNYVPREILTLQAELGANWPEIMKEDADNLTNVILFDAVSPSQTRIRSYGIGYRDTPEYEKLLGFFLSANEGLFRELKTYVEGG